MSHDSSLAISAMRSVPVRCPVCCQPDDSAEFHDRGSNPLVIGGHDDRIDAARISGAPIHMLDHRAAGNVGERFPGKSRRSESGGDDSDSVQGRRSLERIEKPDRGHGES